MFSSPSFITKPELGGAAAAEETADADDKLTGEMRFIGVPIDHSPLSSIIYKIRDRCRFFYPGVDASQLGRVLSGDSYNTHAESGI